DNVYIAVNQGDLRPQDFIADITRDGLPDGQSVVDAKPWERRVSADDRTRSLVLSTPKVTTIVVGDTSYGALESYTATLRA
ncbi:MAG: DUF4245 family protein, partial [Propionibacteriaceae bacterium]|nr:DUF4245 family protein [Propionibacteriaceae bacterium]